MTSLSSLSGQRPANARNLMSSVIEAYFGTFKTLPPPSAFLERKPISKSARQMLTMAGLQLSVVNVPTWMELAYKDELHVWQQSVQELPLQSTSAPPAKVSLDASGLFLRLQDPLLTSQPWSHAAHDLRPILPKRTGAREVDEILTSAHCSLSEEERLAASRTLVAIMVVGRLSFANAAYVLYIYGGVIYSRHRFHLLDSKTVADQKTAMLHPTDFQAIGGWQQLAQDLPAFTLTRHRLVMMASCSVKMTCPYPSFVRSYLAQVEQNAQHGASEACVSCGKPPPVGATPMIAGECILCHFLISACGEGGLRPTPLRRSEVIEAIKASEAFTAWPRASLPGVDAARRLGIDLDYLRFVVPCGNKFCRHALQDDDSFKTGPFVLSSMDPVLNKAGRTDNVLECVDCRRNSDRRPAAHRSACAHCGCKLMRQRNEKAVMADAAASAAATTSSARGVADLPYEAYERVTQGGQVFNFCKRCSAVVTTGAVQPWVDEALNNIRSASFQITNAEMHRAAAEVGRQAGTVSDVGLYPDLKLLRRRVFHKLAEKLVTKESDGLLMAILHGLAGNSDNAGNGDDVDEVDDLEPEDETAAEVLTYLHSQLDAVGTRSSPAPGASEEPIPSQSSADVENAVVIGRLVSLHKTVSAFQAVTGALDWSKTAPIADATGEARIAQLQKTVRSFSLTTI